MSLKDSFNDDPLNFLMVICICTCVSILTIAAIICVCMKLFADGFVIKLL